MASPIAQQNRKMPEPTLADLLNMFKKEIFMDLNCHHWGTVKSFNSTNQTVTATINYKKSFSVKKADGTYSTELRDYPLMLDVPAVILGGGGWNLTFPIAEGDECLLLFNDRAIDNWFQSSQVVAPPSTRLHSFSDAFALVGINSNRNFIQNYDMDRAKLFNGDTLVGVSENKVRIANATQNLNSLLQDLTTQLKSLTTALSTLTVTGVTAGGGTSGVPSNAATISGIGTQIEVIATNIGNLLE